MPMFDLKSKHSKSMYTYFLLHISTSQYKPTLNNEITISLILQVHHSKPNASFLAQNTITARFKRNCMIIVGANENILQFLSQVGSSLYPSCVNNSSIAISLYWLFFECCDDQGKRKSLKLILTAYMIYYNVNVKFSELKKPFGCEARKVQLPSFNHFYLRMM